MQQVEKDRLKKISSYDFRILHTNCWNVNTLESRKKKSPMNSENECSSHDFIEVKTPVA